MMRVDVPMFKAGSIRVTRQQIANSLRLQLIGIIICSVLAPLLVSLALRGRFDLHTAVAQNSIAVSLIASIAGLIFVRRVTAFPGTDHFAYIIPAFSVTFGCGIAALLGFRLDYSIAMLLAGMLAALAFAFLTSFYGSRDPLSFIVVPFGSALDLPTVKDATWILLARPNLADYSRLAVPVVADLHHDLEPEWERMLANAAISGRPVYHSKQLRESLTGKVEIEHLSENSLGSLIPNLAYRKLKRMIDIGVAAVAIPLLILPLAIVALAIRFDSPGPVFFRQRRMGYRGVPFEVLKFRTMRVAAAAQDEDMVQAAITEDGDHRITRLGRFLRRSRIDELPQLWNVLLGQMSLIGPRPEALPLSQWYERELPFYSYRHIVRPGITGWAQVSQGHVADLESVHSKLHYDFYYIKNFSAWMDALIVLKTVHTILTGFGSK